jgi:hypothetical protein
VSPTTSQLGVNIIAAFDINPPAAERFSLSSTETSIAPLCQCARALFGWAVTDIDEVGRAWRGGDLVVLRRWPPNCYFALSALSRNELATAAMPMARIARDISSFVGVR